MGFISHDTLVSYCGVMLCNVILTAWWHGKCGKGNKMGSLYNMLIFLDYNDCFILLFLSKLNN